MGFDPLIANSIADALLNIALISNPNATAAQRAAIENTRKSNQASATAEAAKQTAENAEDARKDSMFGTVVGGVVGAVGGFFAGGPPGAVAGASAGMKLGGSLAGGGAHDTVNSPLSVPTGGDAKQQDGQVIAESLIQAGQATKGGSDFSGGDEAPIPSTADTALKDAAPPPSEPLQGSAASVISQDKAAAPPSQPDVLPLPNAPAGQNQGQGQASAPASKTATADGGGEANPMQQKAAGLLSMFGQIAEQFAQAR